MRLWEEIPESERIDRSFLLGRAGAADPKVLARWEAALARNTGCQAAVVWFASRPQRWKKCGFGAAPGSRFCPIHGGPHFRKPKLLLSRAKTQEALDRAVSNKRRRIAGTLDLLRRLNNDLDALLARQGAAPTPPSPWGTALRELREAALDAFGNPDDCDDCSELQDNPCRIHSSGPMASRLYRAVLFSEDLLGPCTCGHPRQYHERDDERRCKHCACRSFALPPTPETPGPRCRGASKG
jgi:hypothetical protein